MTSRDSRDGAHGSRLAARGSGTILPTALLVAAMALIPAVGAAHRAIAEGSGPEPSAERRAPSAKGAERSEEYLLGPEDRLAITVVGHTDFSGAAVVRPDGKISAPGLGEVQAAGKSVAALQAALQSQLARWIRNPIVSVGVTQFRSLGVVFVLGQVTRPGPYPYQAGLTATEALALAGGALPDADLRQAAVLHTDRTKSPIDLSSLTRSGDAPPTLTLAPGDTLVLPPLPRPRASVLGEVNKPSEYDITEKSTILDLIRLAEGPRPSANLKGATFTRGNTTTTLDLDALLRRGDIRVNRKVQDGDTIFIPENRIKVYVLGEVTKSDTHYLSDGATVLDALTAAGGTTREADLKRVRLGRRGAGTATEVLTLDLNRLVSAEKPLAPTPLRDGDMLLVPSKVKKKSVADYLPFLYPVELLSRLLSK